MKMAYDLSKAPGRRDQDHLTVMTPEGGVRVTLSVTDPSDSSSAYFVLILPLASLKKARGPRSLPPLIFACAEHRDWPQTRQRNDPRRRLMDTSRRHRRGTPRAREVLLERRRVGRVLLDRFFTNS